MGRISRSARGEVIDFDLVTIKQQLSSQPSTLGAQSRQRFIDEKDGIKTRKITYPTSAAGSVASAMLVALQAAEDSANALDSEAEED